MPSPTGRRKVLKIPHKTVNIPAESATQVCVELKIRTINPACFFVKKKRRSANMLAAITVIQTFGVIQSSPTA